MSTLRERLQLLEPGELIELFILDLTSQDGPVLYFHPYAELGANTITFQGNVYQPFPIKAEG
jgi:lambda family phage minor tail protein L